MEIAKVTSKGQITIPKEVRNRLNLKTGDKVLFLEEKGKWVIANASLVALKDAQKAFAGLAQELGLDSDEDVVKFVKQMRRERLAVSHTSSN